MGTLSARCELSILDQARDAMTLENIATKLEQLEQKLGAPKPKPKWRRIFSSTIKIYVFFFSALGFTMFIGEETVQTAGFSCFGYAASKDWTGMDTVCRATYATILDWYCALVDNPIMLIGNPIMQPGYVQYCIAGRSYLKSVESRIIFQK